MFGDYSLFLICCDCVLVACWFGFGLLVCFVLLVLVVSVWGFGFTMFVLV